MPNLRALAAKNITCVVQDCDAYGTTPPVMTPYMGRDLGGLHHRVAQRIKGV